MKQKFIGVLAALTLSSAGIALAQSKPSFADLTWYSSKAAVKKQLLNKGYIFIHNIGQDALFSGKILGNQADVLTDFNNKDQLVKIEIVFEDDDISRLYNTLKSSLSNKYGKGSEINDLSSEMGYDMLVSEDVAKQGKTVQTTWFFPSNYQMYLSLITPYTNDSTVKATIHYESPAWSGELKRRQAGGDL